MLDRDALAKALELQEKSYKLLRWMADGVAKGFIQFNSAHQYATLPAAAEGWIRRHYDDIPRDARPSKGNLEEFCRLFATYLENSFDLKQNPGKQLYSPQHHCFCPICSWLVDAPNLKAKKPVAADKQRARRMMRSVIGRLAHEAGADLDNDALDKFLNQDELRDPVSMVTWADDLLHRLSGAVRLDGQTMGAAPLVLWRGFAWTPTGAPRKGFRPTVKSILESERTVFEALQTSAKR